MKTIIIVLLGLSSLTVNGQITNTTHKDESNIYYHALDSAVKIILTKVKPENIILDGDLYAMNRVPDNLLGLRIIKNDGQKKIKTKDNSATVRMNRLEVENGEFNIFMTLWTTNNGQMRILENGISGYTFAYEFVSSDKSFRLLRIDKSIIIR